MEAESNERKLSGRIARIENRIDELEKEIEDVNKELSTPEIAADYEKSMALSGKLSELETELESAMTEWDGLV